MSIFKKKRLFFDIETSPNIGTFWTAGFKQTITPENIIHERRVICISYKWANEKKVSSLTWSKRQCDKRMLEDFIKIANSADELIGHNGDRYDLAWIRTRCLFHQIAMFPSYTTIDTLKNARSKFRFNSNRLDYIARFLGVGAKRKTGGFGLWMNVLLKNCQRSLAKMVWYCEGDVIVLEKVFNRMSAHIPARVHYGVKNGKTKFSCPECGSDESMINQTKVSAAGVKRVQRQCKNEKCNRYYTTPVQK